MLRILYPGQYPLGSDGFLASTRSVEPLAVEISTQARPGAGAGAGPGKDPLQSSRSQGELFDSSTVLPESFSLRWSLISGLRLRPRILEHTRVLYIVPGTAYCSG